jgi:histidinol dehydrogenase
MKIILGMQVFKLPVRDDWKKILERPAIDAIALEQKVKAILDTVKVEGDTAIQRYTRNLMVLMQMI